MDKDTLRGYIDDYVFRIREGHIMFNDCSHREGMAALIKAIENLYEFILEREYEDSFNRNAKKEKE